MKAFAIPIPIRGLRFGGSADSGGGYYKNKCCQR